MTRSSRREPAREPEGAIARMPARSVKTGRPGGYRPEFVTVVERAAALGATRGEIAAALGVANSTLHDWGLRRPELAAALKDGRFGGRKRPGRAIARALARVRGAADAAGPPSHFRPELIAIARQAAELGGTQPEIAEAMGISRRTLTNWAVRHADLAAALKVGKAAADDRVERALYERAVGYVHEGVRLAVREGKVVATPFVEHHPPDVGAATLWLKNRRPGEWRDKHAHEISGADGAPLPALQVTFVRAGEG